MFDWHGTDWRYWAAVAGAAIYVAARDAETESIKRRIVKTVASAGLALGGSRELAPWVAGSEIAAAVLLMAFGTLALDLATGLIRDRALIRDIVRRRLGGGGDDA